MYYLLLDGAQSGPFTLAQLSEMWQARRIDDLTLYWEDGNADWLPLHNIAPLLQVPGRAAGPVPPLPSTASTSAAATADEQIIWSGHPTLWHWWGELFWGVILSVVLVGIVMLVHVFWSRNTTRYLVTNRRVSVEAGIFTRSSRELRIADIRAIGARKNIFGYGQVDFSTAARDYAEVVFWAIPAPDRVRDLVKQMQNGQS